MTDKNNSEKIRFLLWLKELRAPFFVAVLIPATLGAVVAWNSLGVFNPALFALSLVGVVCVNAGTNLANDYFDFRSGCDSVNTDFHSPFSGGSGLLPSGFLNPRRVHMAAVAFFALASLIGMFLALMRGSLIFGLVLVGALSGYFYTTQLATRGIGEIIVGLNCGPFVVLGSYYVQTQTIALEPVVASIALGILIFEVLLINEIPDCYADAKTGKKTLVTRMGKKKAVHLYGTLMICTYAAVILAVFLSLMPILTLLSLLTAPLALKAVLIARKNHEDPQALIPANATTVIIHLLTGLVIVSAYVATGIMGS